MNGWIQTSSAEDPTLTLASAIVNDTNFAWTAYIVNVYMSSPFTLTNVNVTLPGDWSVVSVSPVTPTNSEYVGTILLDTGAPIPNGGEIDFNYQLQFSGASQFSFTQEVIPVPEPGPIELVALAGGLFAAFTLVRPRRRK